MNPYWTSIITLWDTPENAAQSARVNLDILVNVKVQANAPG